MRPTLRMNVGNPLPSPQELGEIALGGLDDLWEMMVAAEMSRGADRQAAEHALGKRWAQEDKLHLYHKRQFWKAFNRARTHAE